MSALDCFNYSELPHYVQCILSSIIQGNLASLKELVEKTQKEGKEIGWWWDPYATIYSKSQLECLKYVLDQPNFRFDAAFLCACCYFTPKKLRDLVCRHPKAQKWVDDPALLERDASVCYTRLHLRSMDGVSGRLIDGFREIYNHHQRIKRLHSAVVMKVFFTACSRIFVESHYAPGGKGYLKGKASFEAAAWL